MLGVDVEAGGDVRVGVHDGDGGTIDGYECQKSRVVRRDDNDVLCTWQGRAGVTTSFRPLLDRVVRLRVHLFRAKLYSFRFT